jgi:hypothetical protein
MIVTAVSARLSWDSGRSWGAGSDWGGGGGTNGVVRFDLGLGLSLGLGFGLGVASPMRSILPLMALRLTPISPAISA